MHFKPAGSLQSPVKWARVHTQMLLTCLQEENLSGEINKEKAEHEVTKQSLQGARSEIDDLRAQIEQLRKENQEQIDGLKKEVLIDIRFRHMHISLNLYTDIRAPTNISLRAYIIPSQHNPLFVLCNT